MPSPKHLVIHGHFYQPPRENPWSGSIAHQPSAAPFHDWNERVLRECYAPNALARILGGDGKIIKVLNNYARVSHNFGPTLLAWLRDANPKMAGLIAAADKEASAKRGGHGPAIAQVFNHVIMPLASWRDKKTQVKWGKRWFEAFYGRSPEGMWLAETAADTPSLKALAQEGIKFTILAQGQIGAVRPLGGGEWARTEGGADPREPYRIFLGGGESDYLDVFAYDGPISRAIAFENLLRDGQALKSRISGAFGDPLPGDRPRLVNIATDGESYGHHFRFGEMALAWLLSDLEGQGQGDPPLLTTYGEFLSKYPPRLEARLLERTSWSCAHGIERWRSDCGCRVGQGPGWNQKWRAPLRDGLDWLAGELSAIFERTGGDLFKDPWAARDDYVDVLIEKYSLESKRALLAKHAARPLGAEGEARAMAHLEAQLMAMYMFTSCAWFFDDLAGIEPVQNLRYALRAIELSAGEGKGRLEEGLLGFLRKAVPNDPDYPDGEAVWRRLVVPASLSASLAAAHWAAARTLEVSGALSEFKDIAFEEISATLDEELYGERRLKAAIRIRDLRLDSQGALKSCEAATGPGGRGFEILVSGPPGGEAREAFALDDLWPGVRETLLSHLVRGFFEELRSQTLKSFEATSDLLLQYSRIKKPLDWLGKFVFRVVAESKVESFLWSMAQGYPVDAAKLEALLTSGELGGLFMSGTALTAAAQDYLKRLFGQAQDPGGRPTVVSEMAELVRMLKKAHVEIDYWPNQNLWLELAANPELPALAPDAETRRCLHELGELLGFDPSRFLKLAV